MWLFWGRTSAVVTHTQHNFGVPDVDYNVKSHTKVEAFAFMANDLMNAVSRFWWLFRQNLPADHSTDSQAERWETLEVSAVLMLRRGNKKNKTASSAAAQLAEGGGKSQTFKYQQLHH